jgi:hypothetical protein
LATDLFLVGMTIVMRAWNGAPVWIVGLAAGLSVGILMTGFTSIFNKKTSTGFVAILFFLLLGCTLKSSFAVPSSSSVNLHFPNQQVGKLFKVEVLKNGLITKPNATDKAIIARGDVTVERSQPLLFVMNYAGSENTSYLEGMSDANVVSLDMNNLENVNDETFKHLAKWTKLRRLLANSTDLSDEGLKFLKSAKCLTTINACGTLIKGPGLSALADLPEVQRIGFARNGMRGFNFSQLPPFKKLMDIDLSGCAINDSACVYLNQVSTLWYLNLAKNKITDVGISHLTGLKNLLEINLIGTSVTPAAAVSLAKLPRLGRVVFGEAQLSELSVIRFKKALPAKCLVELRKSDDKIDANVFAPLK